MAGTPIFLKWFLHMHVSIYRKSGGKIMGRLAGNDILLLTTTGRKSGEKRTTPLTYFTDGDRYIIVASNGGKSQHPGWYFNLTANPQAQVQVRAEVLDVTAKQAAPEERKALWAKVLATGPQYARYASQTAREIPLMILQRTK
jgi:deazaflavin-dependent oxidoreductase (nitroreductase family)